MLATSPSGRTVISTSEREMAARATIRENHAQDPTTLLGKMLRIDVNVPDGDIHGYRVPTDNPFLDNVPIPALPEIWDFGMRNPWRFSFDVGPGGTGALLIADVGQNVEKKSITNQQERAGATTAGVSGKGLVRIFQAPRGFCPSSIPSMNTSIRSALS